MPFWGGGNVKTGLKGGERQRKYKRKVDGKREKYTVIKGGKIMF
jgi:hypothetical protein